jgi:cell division protein FtsZ
VEAAQEAVSSPLLDDVSIKGAKGVLINITGGMDLAIDEVTQISTIIQEEAGDEAEIIFGAVHDPELEGKIRVTVIATGFGVEEDRQDHQVIRPDFRRSPAPRAETRVAVESGVREERKVAVAGGMPQREVVAFQRPPDRLVERSYLGELDIPTFIRRQMD